MVLKRTCGYKITWKRLVWKDTTISRNPCKPNERHDTMKEKFPIGDISWEYGLVLTWIYIGPDSCVCTPYFSGSLLLENRKALSFT